MLQKLSADMADSLRGLLHPDMPGYLVADERQVDAECVRTAETCRTDVLLPTLCRPLAVPEPITRPRVQ